MGSIKSPNYPQNFPANVECSWQIIAHEGNHVEMFFNEEFQIPDSSGVCLSSYVKVQLSRPGSGSGSESRSFCLLVDSCRRGQDGVIMLELCCPQAVAPWPPGRLVPPITSSPAASRAATPQEKDSWPASAPVRCPT